MDHEQTMVRAFFAPEKRARYLSLLSTAHGREKLVSALPHLDALDARFYSPSLLARAGVDEI